MTGGNTANAFPLGLRILSALALAAAAGATRGDAPGIRAELEPRMADVYVGEAFAMTLSISSPEGILGQTFELLELPPETVLWRAPLEELPVERRFASGNVVETRRFRFRVHMREPADLRFQPSLSVFLLQRPPPHLGMALQTTRHTLGLPAVRLRARALPETGRPADCSGAVGAFRLQIEFDSADAQAGEPLVLTARLLGGRFPEPAPAPRVAPSPHFRIESPVLAPVLRPDVRVFRFITVPQNTEARCLGPVTFTYFDPSGRVYRTLQEGPFPVSVHAQPPQDDDAPIPGPERKRRFACAPPSFPTGTVGRRGAAARIAPAQEALVTFVIPGQTGVRILEAHAGWYRVAAGNDEGWISGRTLVPAAPEDR